MTRRIVAAIVLLVVLVVGAVAVGGVGYSWGVARGLADSGKLVAPVAGGVVPYMYGMPFYPHPFGFGFGFLGCLIPLLGIFLIFGLVRMVIFGGRRGWGGHGWGRHGWGGPGMGGHDFGPGGEGVPPMFAEWHKRSHADPKPEPPAQ